MDDDDDDDDDIIVVVVILLVLLLIITGKDDDVSLRILLYSSLDVLIEGDGWKEALKSRSQEQILRGIVEALNN